MRSYAKAFFAPILLAIIQAVEGNTISGVAVAQMIKSISSAEVLVFAKSPFIALVPSSELPLPSSFNILLSFTPVLLTIHSSLVSTRVSSSLFVKT